ncbi:MAG TPA: hypothetical protein VKV02_00330 [Acidobacteriaceae bacterium]|nr:hypothetical protein [Acidobacteriaceae bacterium]
MDNTVSLASAVSLDSVDAAGWEEAKRVRGEFPRWVVIWSEMRGMLMAWPLFRAPRGTVVMSISAMQLIADMKDVEDASTVKIAEH